MSGYYKQHYLDLHPSIFIHPAFSEIWRILSDIWKSIKFIQQISFEEKASIQQIGNFFSDSLNIPRLVHIYQNIKTWMTKVMTTAKVIFCSNQDVGGKDIHLDLRIFKRPNRCKLGTANSEYKFPFWEEGGLLSLFDPVSIRGGRCLLHPRPRLHCSSDRTQDNELCRASRPCWEQQKPAKHKGNAQRPRIPWDTNPSKPLCAAWGAATTTVGRGAQRGAKGGHLGAREGRGPGGHFK